MLIRGNDIWVANVGDSRAVLSALCRASPPQLELTRPLQVMARRVGDHIEGIPLTRDHKPSEPDERY